MHPELKLIVSDLDGTLLRNDRTLSSYTRSVLSRCRKKGYFFLPATARPPRDLEASIPGLEYDGAVCHNGGVVLLRGEVLWQEGIEPETASGLLRKICEAIPGVRACAEVGGELYANFRASEIWPGCPYRPSNFLNLPEKPAEKLLIGLASPEDACPLQGLLPENLSLRISENRVAMIQKKGVEKPGGLQKIGEALGLSCRRAVAFGDDYNDISLLQACGMGIAVGNALPEVKAAADCVCLSNEEDGPAQWLEKHLLGGKP